MPSVKNLIIKLQSGSNSTYYASWEFKEDIKNKPGSGSGSDGSGGGAIKSGDLVSIKSGATYYNGVHIPSWVMEKRWYVLQITGDRAVIDKNEGGGYSICSAINVNNLVKVSRSRSISTYESEDEKTLDHYEVKWYYYTGDGVWFTGGSSDIKEKNATYNPPENSIQIKVTVKPISKTYTVNDKETYYWTGTAASATYSTQYDPPEKPSAPTVTIDKYSLTAKIENVSDPRTDQIQFEVYNGTKKVSTGITTVLTCRATYVCTVDAGGDYRVRCRAINLNKDAQIYSLWSDFSSSMGTIPSTPSKITSCKATSETSVYLEWTKVTTATTYDIEYTTKKEYFDGSDKTTTKTGIEFNHFELTGIETGQQYFFRVRAVNDKGHSSWSTMATVTIGKKPSAPTTWSSTTTAITGEPLTLYWVHNSEDGSSQTYAELELIINGIRETHTIENTNTGDDKDKTSFYAVDTSKYIEGTTIKWRVRTAGITKAYGDWSVQRTIDIYAPATLGLSVTDVNGSPIEVLKSFPFYISALAGPKTQVPIGYHLTVKSNVMYETVDQVGNVRIINKGEQVYTKYFDTSEALLVEMSANNIDLENEISYTITCTVSMNSGLTAETSTVITVKWLETRYEPDAEIAIDENTYSAYIRPYCLDEDGNNINDVLLGVYRREFDGSFTEIANDIDSITNTFITDPHPALDYARYRIIAKSKTTGSISYYDPPGYPIGGIAVIIQWDEEWTNFETSNEDALENPPWSGSLLKIPYNIDVSDGNKADVSLVSYIGRTKPVSYYGTQLGQTSTWNMVIPKEDKETLYSLRRLSIWMGDVYVREPSGSGYWAHVSVSFSQKHNDLTIPITLDITRVEGGA